jgi:hypothetical protein
MGCICGPSIANLYLYLLEMKWLIIRRPLVYYRFIDDIFIVLENELDFEEFESTFVYLKLSVSTGELVNFLDLNIAFNSLTSKIKFSLYTKDTHVNKLLLPTSNHPPHIFKNIPHSLFIRIRRICSDYYDFIDAAKKLGSNLLERGYELKQIRTIFNLTSNLERFDLLPYKYKTNQIDFSKNIPFFFIYNYNFNHFNSLIFDSYKKTCLNYSFLNNFKLQFINNIEKNLNSIFVHNFKLSFPTLYHTSKCNECRICPFIYVKNYISLNNLSLNLLSNADCNSTNLVYIILCVKCNLFYIGETSKSLKVRIKQHLDSILKFIPFKKYQDKEVAKHFNLHGHNYLSDFKCCVFKCDLLETDKRQACEYDLVKVFNIYKQNCLNALTKKHNFKSLAFL